MYNVEMINKDKVEERLNTLDENMISLKEAIEFSFNYLNEKIDNKTDGLILRIDELASSTETQFSMINLRFDEVDRRFKDVNERIDSIQTGIDLIGSSQNLLAEDIRSLDSKFTPLLGLLALLEKK